MELALKFVCPFIIREGAFCSNKVENLIVVISVIDVTSNQLSISYQAAYVWPGLKKKVPLVLNLVHRLKCSLNTFLVKDINHAFEKEEQETLLLLS